MHAVGELFQLVRVIFRRRVVQRSRAECTSNANRDCSCGFLATLSLTILFLKICRAGPSFKVGF